MTREEAMYLLNNLRSVAEGKEEEAIDMAIEALSAEATKKKAELKDNGDWDCPDVDCEECAHNRSVSWCSLAIPSHEEIDDTYKMVSEAFFEGVEVAEKRYRFLIETVEELDKKSADADAVAVVRCKDCQYRKKVGTSYYCELDEFNVQDADFCSWGERREK